jgi:hypothetical protein
MTSFERTENDKSNNSLEESREVPNSIKLVVFDTWIF